MIGRHVTSQNLLVQALTPRALLFRTLWSSRVGRELLCALSSFLPQIGSNGLFTRSFSGARSIEYTGVYFSDGKWRARSRFNGRSQRRGGFDCEADAAHAYDSVLRGSGTPLHRWFRLLNFPTALEKIFEHGSLARVIENRERNLAKYGGNNEKEAIAVKQLIDLMSKSSVDRQFEFVWRLPEGTLADGIFRHLGSDAIKDRWKGIQVKSCSNRSNRGVRFFHVGRYDGLLIICVALMSSQFWAIPGRALHHSTGLYISQTGGKWSPYELTFESLLRALMSVWDDNEKYALRSRKDWETLGMSKNHLVAHLAHLQGSRLLARVGFAVSTPFVENTTTDMIINNCVRVQEKARTRAANQSGSYNVKLLKHNGRLQGNRTICPYQSTDFDLLIAYLWRHKEEEIAGFFAIPMHMLLEHCTVGGMRLVQGLCLYPPWSLPKRTKSSLAKEWQAHYWFDSTFVELASDVSRLRGIVASAVVDATLESKI